MSSVGGEGRENVRNTFLLRWERPDSRGDLRTVSVDPPPQLLAFLLQQVDLHLSSVQLLLSASLQSRTTKDWHWILSAPFMIIKTFFFIDLTSFCLDAASNPELCFLSSSPSRCRFSICFVISTCWWHQSCIHTDAVAPIPPADLKTNLQAFRFLHRLPQGASQGFILLLDLIHVFDQLTHHVLLEEWIAPRQIATLLFNYFCCATCFYRPLSWRLVPAPPFYHILRFHFLPLSYPAPSAVQLSHVDSLRPAPGFNRAHWVNAQLLFTFASSSRIEKYLFIFHKDLKSAHKQRGRAASMRRVGTCVIITMSSSSAMLSGLCCSGFLKQKEVLAPRTCPAPST